MKAGDAHLLTIPPHVKDQQRGLKPYREAREDHRGLWKLVANHFFQEVMG